MQLSAMIRENMFVIFPSIRMAPVTAYSIMRRSDVIPAVQWPLIWYLAVGRKTFTVEWLTS